MKFFAHILTLISEIVIFILAVAAYFKPFWLLKRAPDWLITSDVKLLIAMIGAGTAILISLFFRSKDDGDEKDGNVVKTEYSINSPVLQNNHAPVNIDYSTGKVVYTVDIDKLKEELTAASRKQIDELQNRITELQSDKDWLKSQVSGQSDLLKQMLVLSKEKADLEQKIADTEAKIQDIVKYYETVDINSSPLYREAFGLLVKGKLDEALAVLDEARLEQMKRRTQTLVFSKLKCWN
jgi:chaperonin cofactor prefoldin